MLLKLNTTGWVIYNEQKFIWLLILKAGMSKSTTPTLDKDIYATSFHGGRGRARKGEPRQVRKSRFAFTVTYCQNY